MPSSAADEQEARWNAEILFNDCTLVCCDNAHCYYNISSSVLSTQSPVLKRELLSDFKEAREKVIKVRGLTEQYFHKFALYFLGQIPKLDDLEEAIQLYIVAHHYQIDSLKSICLKKLAEKVDCDNVCELAQMASVYEEAKLKTAVKKCFARDLKGIRHTESYKSLVENHNDFMLELLMELLTDIIEGEEKIIVIGGCQFPWDIHRIKLSSSPLIFDPSTETVTHWKSLKIPRQGHMAGKLRDKILVCGGEIDGSTTATNRVEIFIRNSEHSIEGPPMNVKRKYATGVVHGSHFYAFSGVDENNEKLSSCERYSFETNQWELLQQHIPDAMWGFSAVAHSNNIYIIGGFGAMGGGSQLVYRYNTLSSQLCSIKPMHRQRYLATCTLRKAPKKILVTGGYGTERNCEQYDMETDTWEKVADMKRERVDHALIDYKDVVYAIGGLGEDSVEKLDEEESGEWKLVTQAKLPSGLFDFAAVVF